MDEETNAIKMSASFVKFLNLNVRHSWNKKWKSFQNLMEFILWFKGGLGETGSAGAAGNDGARVRNNVNNTNKAFCKYCIWHTYEILVFFIHLYIWILGSSRAHWTYWTSWSTWRKGNHYLTYFIHHFIYYSQVVIYVSSHTIFLLIDLFVFRENQDPEGLLDHRVLEQRLWVSHDLQIRREAITNIKLYVDRLMSLLSWFCILGVSWSAWASWLSWICRSSCECKIS